MLGSILLGIRSAAPEWRHVPPPASCAGVLGLATCAKELAVTLGGGDAQRQGLVLLSEKLGPSAVPSGPGLFLAKSLAPLGYDLGALSFSARSLAAPYRQFDPLLNGRSLGLASGAKRHGDMSRGNTVGGWMNGIGALSSQREAWP